MRTRRPRCLLLSLFGLLTPTLASAQWVVNGNPVCTASGAQDGIDISANGLAGAVMVWQDSRGASTDIYARQVDFLGNNEWTGNGVALCTAINGQLYPHVVHDGFGYMVYTWEDYRAGNADQYCAITDRLGNLFTVSDGFAVSSGAGEQRGASLAANQALGVAYLAWTDTRGGNNDIYGQAFNVYNHGFWTAGGLPFCTLASDQTGAVVAPDGGDGGIVAWQDFRNGNYDIYAQRANLSNQLLWTTNGVPVCTFTSAQLSPMIVSDGAGGAIVAWQDQRNGVFVGSIYAQRISSTGAQLWAANGVPIVVSTDLIILPKMIPDGAGGAIFVWEDDRNIATTGPDIYAQRINASGVVQWAANGVVACSAPYAQATPDAAPDGSGGVVVAWQDVRTLGPSDVYAQHLNAFGMPMWTNNGVSVSTATGNQFNAQIAQSEAGAAIAAWEDRRTGNVADVYAQRLDTGSGLIGYPQPYIMSITDVPNDQGGWVRITFRAGDNEFPGTEYEIYDAEYHGGDLVDLVSGNGSASYTRDVITVGVATPNTYWVYNGFNSNFVQGTSIDNIAPPAPVLSGQRVGLNVNLSWNATGGDTDGYTLTRADAGELVETNILTYTDVGVPAIELHYLIRAFDIHGNLSVPSNEVVIATPTGVGDTPSIPAVLTLMPNTPNPFTSSTSLRIGMPATGDAQLEVFDVAGRRVASRGLGTLQAGWREVPFDARDDHGQPLASGVYLYRVRAGGATHSSKMVISR